MWLAVIWQESRYQSIEETIVQLFSLSALVPITRVARFNSPNAGVTLDL